MTSLNETEILKVLSSETEDNRFRWLRNMGLEEQPPSVSIMMSFWSHPLIITIIAIWAIARGSIAVGAEVERGTLDLILSRPVSRTTYLFTHVLMAIFGSFSWRWRSRREQESARITTTSACRSTSGPW